MVDRTEFNLVPENEEEIFNLSPNDEDEEFTVEFGEVINVGGGGTNDFNALNNRPKYDGTTMTGNTNIPQVPSKTSDLTNDGADGTSTYVEADDLATVATSGSYNDLNNKPTIPAAQIQSDWTQADNTKVDYIKNKPTIPAAQVNSDWNADSGVAQILNKPTIPTVNDATLTITQNGISKGTFTANDDTDTTIEVSDTTYSNFTGTDGNTGGTAGLVPAPLTTDADKFLKSDGTWATAGGGGGGGDTVYSTVTTSNDSAGGAVYIGNLDATQTEQPDPTSTDNHWKYYWALPQNNTTKPKRASINIGGSESATYAVVIGFDAYDSSNTSAGGNVIIGNSAHAANTARWGGVIIGQNAWADKQYSTALGASAVSNYTHSVALGDNSQNTRDGEVYIGPGGVMGFNSSAYRVLGGVYDGQNAHDAVTVGQVNATIDAINTALSTNIPHIGA